MSSCTILDCLLPNSIIVPLTCAQDIQLVALKSKLIYIIVVVPGACFLFLRDTFSFVEVIELICKSSLIKICKTEILYFSVPNTKKE